MLGLVLGELAVLIGVWAAFIAVYARRSWHRSPMGRQLMAVAVVGLLEALGLFALGTGHRLPMWAYALIFGAVDVVMAGWLVLLWRAGREEGEL